MNTKRDQALESYTAIYVPTGNGGAMPCFVWNGKGTKPKG